MKTRQLSYISVAILALILAGCSAIAGSNASGSVQTPMPSDTPLLGSSPTPTPTPPPGSSDTNLPAPTDTPVPQSSGTVEIKIRNFAFDPSNITIKAGATVRWSNMDGVTHSITSDTGLWDSGGVAQGDSNTRVFDTPGTYPYHCGVHPTMKGTIAVTS